MAGASISKGLGGAASVAAVIPGGQPIALGLGLLSMGVGMFGGKAPEIPTWDDLAYSDDFGYTADTNFGADIARTGRAGVNAFEDKTTSFLSKSMESEERRLRRMAGDMTPGTAALRGAVAASGVSGSGSNVMAKQQREAMMAKSRDAAFGASEASRSRYDAMFVGALSEAERLRQGYTGMEIDATGRAATAKNQQYQYNAGVRYDLAKFNQTGQFNADTQRAQINNGYNQNRSENFLSMGNQFMSMALGPTGYQTGYNNNNGSNGRRR